VLGSGRSGTVWKSKLHGRTGALKIVDLYGSDELLGEIVNEINIYVGPLVDIQGKYVPKLLRFGVLHEAFVFIFTSLAGRSFAELEHVTSKEKELALEGLQAIHTRGVMHGDVRLENIMLSRNPLTGESYVQWIDFAWSKIQSVEVLDRELIKLKRLLRVIDYRGKHGICIKVHVL
jgi:serine/threonine protein kinase